ncbi:hypothetical protein COCON_G00061540 [Conger conger]|uniref:Uncharacterized protein n=1 Tax=Conger conger TaxID=82655 RepID=A0A9Q1DRF4_CONCO|nr:hypothetical protein COCON_G00061540 [Conger conger]
MEESTVTLHIWHRLYNEYITRGSQTELENPWTRFGMGTSDVAENLTTLQTDLEGYASEDNLNRSSGPGICNLALSCISRIGVVLSRYCCCCCCCAPQDIIQEPELRFPCQETSQSSVQPF